MFQAVQLFSLLNISTQGLHLGNGELGVIRSIGQPEIPQGEKKPFG